MQRSTEQAHHITYVHRLAELALELERRDISVLHVSMVMLVRCYQYEVPYRIIPLL